MIYINVEVNCTDPSPSVSIPWLYESFPFNKPSLDLVYYGFKLSVINTSYLNEEVNRTDLPPQ